jgi:hypothetical protein
VDEVGAERALEAEDDGRPGHLHLVAGHGRIMEGGDAAAGMEERSLLLAMAMAMASASNAVLRQRQRRARVSPLMASSWRWKPGEPQEQGPYLGRMWAVCACVCACAGVCGRCMSAFCGHMHVADAWMCMRMHVGMRVHLHVGVRADACGHVCACACGCACGCMWACVCMCMWMCMRVHVGMCMWMHAGACVHAGACGCMCMWMHVGACVHVGACGCVHVDACGCACGCRVCACGYAMTRMWMHVDVHAGAVHAHADVR